MERYYFKKYVDDTGVTTFIGKFDDAKPIDERENDFVAEGVWVEADDSMLKVYLDRDIIDTDDFSKVDFISESDYKKHIDNFTYIIEKARGVIPF